MSQSVSQVLTATQLHEVTEEKQGTLGQVAVTRDGRAYVYAKAGATALVAGAAVKANGTAPTVTLAAAPKVGDRYLKFATALSEANAKLLEDAVINLAGAQFLATASDKAGVSLIDAIDINTDSTSATATLNAYRDVVARGESGTIIGYPEVAVPAGFYCWLRAA